MNDPRLQTLLDKYSIGTLTDEDRDELECALLVSPSARADFWQHARFHSLLARWGQESWGHRIAEKPSRKSSFIPLLLPRSRPARRFAAAAMAALAGFACWLWMRQAPPADAGGVAVLARAVDAVWLDADVPRLAGQILTPGKIHLASGLAQIEFFNGTRLLAQGPADLEILTSNRTYCHSGSFRFHVPPRACDFTVESAAVSVVDRGADFGVSVNSGGLPEVHVFSGSVEMNLPGTSGKPIPMREGNAVRVRGLKLESITVSPDAFVDEQELAKRAFEASRAAFAHWQHSADTLCADPAARFHLIFEDEPAWSRTVTNRATRGSGPAALADLVGCQWTAGRWPEKHAIQLRGKGERLRLDVTEPMSAISLFASLKIDSLPNSTHALLSPDSKNPGAVRWELDGKGCLRLGIAVPSGKAEPNWEVVISPQAVTPTHFGCWITLATTFDGSEVKHYLNGELVASGRAHHPGNLTIGAAEIGNWIEGPPRNLPATIDEFLIIGRALSPREIRTHAGTRGRGEL